MQRALDQPAALELVEQVEQRSVLVLIPAELVAQLGLADVEPGAVDPGEDLLLQLGGNRARLGVDRDRRSSLPLSQAAKQRERATGASAALGAAGLLPGGVQALVAADHAHLQRVAGTDQTVAGASSAHGAVRWSASEVVTSFGVGPRPLPRCGATICKRTHSVGWRMPARDDASPAAATNRNGRVETGG